MSSADRLHEPKSWRLGTGLLALLAICLVPAVAGAALYLSHLRDTALRDAYRAADLVAIGTSDRLRWLLQDAEAMLASMAARPLVRSADPTACDPLLAEFRTISPAFKTLALRLTDGRSLCSELPQPPSQQSVAAAPWFQAAVRQPGFHVSDGHLGNVQNEWTVRLTYPVKDASGQTVALLITPLDLRQLQERLFAQLPASNLGAVVDAANRVLVRSTLQGERAGKPAVENVSRGIDALRREARAAGVSAPASLQFPGVGIDGVRRLFVIRTVPMSGWVAVSGVPEDETLRDYRATRNRSQALILVVLLAAGLAAWRVSRGIRLPILGLAAAARSVARGDLAPRAPDAGPTEIRDVAREFNSMVERPAQLAVDGTLIACHAVEEGRI